MSMNKIITKVKHIFLLTILLAVSQSVIVAEQSESDRLNEFFENFFNETVDFYPEYQSYLGIKDNADKWNNYSAKFDKKMHKRTKKALKKIKKDFDRSKLNEEAKLSYDLFVKDIKMDLYGYKYRYYNYPVNQMFGTHADLPAFLINIHQVKTVKDANDYISRLNGIPEVIVELIKGLKKREKVGVVPPKFVFPKVIDDSKNVISGKPFDNDGEDSPLLADFKSKVASFDNKDELIAQAKTALVSQVKPAYEKLITFLKGQHKRATTDDGVWKFKNGDDFFKYRLKIITTTDLTSEEIHELGLKEVARIHGEMREIMAKVGFNGSLQDFFKFMREDQQFYYENTDEGRQQYLDTAVAVIDTIQTDLDRFFITKPKAKLIVKRVEAFREKSAGKAFYQRPAPDGSRPGIYYANLYDMATMPIYQLEALAYHEGIPGHHMQLSISQELKDVPKFRKYGGYTAYTEGWGLYSEYIPKEFGYYSDPYSDFGRLAMELWRACRLVVDTGIHSMKWTREDGIKYYHENTPDAREDGVRMVERHIVMPGQATAYKIGMLKIQELGEKARKKLGDKFDIREFHDQVLIRGPIPLDYLEQKIYNWIKSKL